MSSPTTPSRRSSAARTSCFRNAAQPCGLGLVLKSVLAHRYATERHPPPRRARTTSGGSGRLGLGRVKYIRRVSTPEHLSCVDHPGLVRDPVGIRSAETWREDPRSFPRRVACRRRCLTEWSNDVHRVRLDSARGADGPSERSRRRRCRARAGVGLTDDYATFPRPERTGTPPPVAVIPCVGTRRKGCRAVAR